MTIIIEWKKNTSHFVKNFTLSDSVGDVMCPTGTEIVIFRHPMDNHFTPQKHTNFWKQREHILFGKSFILSDLVGDTVCLMGTEIDIFRTPMVCFFTQSGFPPSVFPKSRLPSCLICTRKIVVQSLDPGLHGYQQQWVLTPCSEGTELHATRLSSMWFHTECSCTVIHMTAATSHFSVHLWNLNWLYNVTWKEMPTGE